MSLAWNPKDSDLLLSSSKDNRTICWNPKNGTIVGELPPTNNWTFDVQWSPKNPDLLSAASFDGKVSIFSLQSLGQSEAPIETNDPFAPNQPAKAFKSNQAPKWLKRSISATFAFGGKLVSFSGKSTQVNIRTIVSLRSVVERSQKLETALEQNDLRNFIHERIPESFPPALAQANPSEVVWRMLDILFQSDPRQKLLGLLGIDRMQLEQKMVKMNISQANIVSPVQDLSVTSEETSSAVTHENSLFGDSGVEFTDLIKQPPMSNTNISSISLSKNSPFSIFTSDSTAEDKLITQAILVGDFESAVDICIHSQRLSDALLLAVCGGPDLLAKTQKIYFSKSTAPYLRIASAVLNNDLEDIVTNAAVEQWEEILGLLCTFSNPEVFSPLCSTLGQRLEASGKSVPAVLCYLAAGNLGSFVKLWLSMGGKSQNSCTWLQDLVEKIIVFREAIKDDSAPIDSAQLKPMYEKFGHYAEVLASQGELYSAAKYLNEVNGHLDIDGSLESNHFAILRDRVYNAVPSSYQSQVEIPPFPFSRFSVSLQQTSFTSSVANPYEAKANEYQSQQYSQYAGQQYSQQYTQPPQPHTRQTQIPSETVGYAMNEPRRPAVPIPGPRILNSQPLYPQQHAQQTVQPMYNQAPRGPPPMKPMMPTKPPMPGPTVQQRPSGAVPLNPSQNPYANFVPPEEPSYGNEQFSANQRFTSQPGTTQPPRGPPNPVSIPPQQEMSRSYSAGGRRSFSSQSSPVIPPPTEAVQSSYHQPPSATVRPAVVSRTKSGYNDPPMVTPRVPTQSRPHAPIVAPFATTQEQARAPAVSEASSAPNPAPVGKPRHPNGDRSHILPAHKPIVTAVTQLLELCKQRCAPNQRRIVADADKRINIMLDQLNNQDWDDHVTMNMLRMAENISRKQFDEAWSIHQALLTTSFEQVGTWIIGLKRLIEAGKNIPQ